MTFPSIPKSLRDMIQLAQWLLKLENWATAKDALLDAIYRAEVHQVSESATIDPSWDVVEYTGPGGHTLTLPKADRAGQRRGRTLYVMNNGAAAITLAAQAGDNIEGDTTQPFGGQATTVVNSSGGLVGLVSNGALKWRAFGGLSAWVRIRNNGGSGAGTHVPFEVDDAGSRVFYVECGGSAPHVHCGLALVSSGSLTINGDAVKLGSAAATVGFYGNTGVTQQVLATGAGRTVDDVITALQAVKLVKQS